MKLDIRKNWLTIFTFIVKNPIVLTPFIIIAFLETLSLEIAYFSARKPLALFFGPIIRKFFGESFTHFPGNMVALPQLFYYAQMVIYIFASVLLAAIAIQIFVNIRTGHPVIIKAILKSTFKRYAAFAGYGFIYIFLIFILDRGEGIAALKAARYISRHAFKISPELYSTGMIGLSFLTFVIVQTFFILTVPILITEKKSLFRAVLGSVSVAARNFLKIFSLILAPFLLYLPTMVMKTFMTPIIDKTFPEISFYIMLFGISIAVFIDSFVMMSAAQFLLDTKKTK